MGCEAMGRKVVRYAVAFGQADSHGHRTSQRTPPIISNPSQSGLASCGVVRHRNFWEGLVPSTSTLPFQHKACQLVALSLRTASVQSLTSHGGPKPKSRLSAAVPPPPDANSPLRSLAQSKGPVEPELGPANESGAPVTCRWGV